MTINVALVRSVAPIAGLAIAGMLLLVLVWQRSRSARGPYRMARALSARGTAAYTIAQRVRISDDVARLVVRQNRSASAEAAAPATAATRKPGPAAPTRGRFIDAVVAQ